MKRKGGDGGNNEKGDTLRERESKGLRSQASCVQRHLARQTER